MPSRGRAAVQLPKNVFRVRRPSGVDHYYWQVHRGRPDHSHLVRLPEPSDPEFWRTAKRLNEGEPEVVKTAPGSFSALIASYKESAKYKNLSIASRDVYDICLERLEAAWGRQPVIAIFPSHVYELLDSYADRPSMGNMIVQVLRTALKHGVRAGYTQVNAAREIESLDEASIGSEPWPEGVYAHVLRHAPALIMRAAVLGRATGQRAVDLVKLRPADREANGVNMTVQKIGNVKHWAPLQAEALAVIDGWGGEKMIPYLASEGRRITAVYLQEAWRKWRTRTPSVPPDATLHDLRAMAVCDRRLAGVPHQQIADQLCMSLPMVMRYSKHIDKAANAQAGMATMERAENVNLKRVYDAAETRGG